MTWPAEQPSLVGEHALQHEVALPVSRAPGVVVPLRRAAQPRSAAAVAGLDWFEIAVLTLFAALSMYVLALNLWLSAAHHLIWTGIDGQYPTDQLQYLAWVQDAARHVLASDLFTLGPTPHDYLQPIIAISGGFVAAGVPPWLTLLLWKPLAVVAIFLAARAYTRRLIPAGATQRAALVLALFAASIRPFGNEWLPFESWGYPFDLLAVAALVGALLAYDRSAREGRILSIAPLFGLLASWLHPWQGETLVLLICGSELVRLVLDLQAVPRADLALRRRFARPLVAIAATSLPLVYYAALDRFDPAWHIARIALEQRWPLQRLLLPLVPLIIAAAPAYARRPKNFLAVATRTWPLAALLTWGINQTGFGAWSVYGWLGITLPLGILAAESFGLWGFSRNRSRRLVGVLAVGVLTIPGSISLVAGVRSLVAPTTENPNLISRPESQALSYLAQDPKPGGVLAPVRTAELIPGETGRRTYVGDNRWSSHYVTRADASWSLLHGWMKPKEARAFVTSTGARFVLGDCRSQSLVSTLGATISSVHHFGCETLYVIR